MTASIRPKRKAILERIKRIIVAQQRLANGET
jgi:hypothetical protein